MTKSIALAVLVSLVSASAAPADSPGRQSAFGKLNHDERNEYHYSDRDNPLAATREDVRPTRGARDSIAAAQRRIETMEQQIANPATSYGRRIVLERQLKYEQANLAELLATAPHPIYRVSSGSEPGH